jgi:hypothetical protein
MGEIQLPLYGNRTHSFLETMTLIRLNLEARAVSGSGSLMADAFVMIPAEHLMVWNDATIAASDEGGYVETQEDGRVVGVVVRGTSPDETVDEFAAVTTHNWRFPKGGGVFIIAAQRVGGTSVVTDQIDVSLIMRKRWLGYAD